MAGCKGSMGGFIGDDKAIGINDPINDGNE